MKSNYFLLIPFVLLLLLSKLSVANVYTIFHVNEDALLSNPSGDQGFNLLGAQGSGQVPCSFQIDSIYKIEPTCHGYLDGEATVFVSGGSSPYYFVWSTGGNSQSEAGLIAGTHSVTVTDINGCSESATFYLAEPNQLSISSQTTAHVLCPDETIGAISSTASGGVAPYSYLWNTGDATSSVQGLNAGFYTVTVTDVMGCTSTSSSDVIAGSFMLPTINIVSPLLCSNDSTGVMQASVLGNGGPFAYNWSNGTNGSSLQNVEGGVYYVTISDVFGCSVLDSMNLISPSPISITVNSINHVTSLSPPNGSVSVNSSGGVSPYSYVWNTSDTTAGISGLNPGIYVVTVTDDNNCSLTESLIITSMVPPLSGTIITDSNVSCHGFNDGGASASVVGGVPPYSFSWSNGSIDSTINGLTAGIFTITITDSQGSTVVDTVYITEPSLIVASLVIDSNVSCSLGSNGGVSVVVTGGNGSYGYTWSNGDIGHSVTGLVAGSYTVTVSDSNGCIAIDSVTLNSVSNLSPTIVASSGISCFGMMDGALSASANGVVTPWGYSWSNGDIGTGITGLNAGVYSLTVTDVNGCADSTSFNLSEPDELEVHVSIPPYQPCSNSGDLNTIYFGGTLPYTYQWSTGSTSSMISNLPSGTYTITLSDANGCSVSDSATISIPTSLSISASVSSHATTPTSTDGEATVVVSGGIPPYSYTWSSQDTSANIVGLNAGTYTVTVQDQDGCFDQDSVKVVSNDWGIADNIIGSSSGEFSGYEICMPDDSTIAVASIFYYKPGAEEAGRVRIFELIGGAWMQKGDAIEGDDAYDWCGSSISMPSKNTIVVGMPSNTWAGTNNEGKIRVFDWNGSSWVQRGVDINGSLVHERFGYSVSMPDENTFAVGTIGRGSTFNDPGYVQVYSWNGSSWVQKGTNITGAIGDGTGFNVSMPDANTIAISFSGNDEVFVNAGKVEVYSWNGVNWVQKGNSLYGDAANDNIGRSISMPNATTLAISSPYSDGGGIGSGTVKIYNWDGSSWQQKGGNVYGAPSEFIGWSISMPNPNTFTVSSPSINTSTGRVKVYAWNGFSWSQKGTNQNGNGSFEELGFSTSMPSSGVFAAGAPFANSDQGYVRVYRYLPCTLQTQIATQSPIFCDSSGIVTVTALSGTIPYNFMWSTGQENIGSSFSVDSILSLPAGNYTVTVTDDNFCESVETIQILSDSNYHPLGLAIGLDSPDLNSTNSGAVSPHVTNGTPPYQYGWSNGSNDMAMSGLSAGMYELTVTDNVGCSISDSIIVPSCHELSGIWSIFSGTTPSSDICITNGNVETGSDAVCQDLTVGIHDTLRVRNTLLVTGDITNYGAIIIEEGGYLIQTVIQDNNTGNGYYEVRQASPNYMDDTKFSYWSSPVKGEQLKDVFPQTNTNDFYKYNNAPWVLVPDTTSMLSGIGYTATGDMNSSGSVVRSFASNRLNNGTISLMNLGTDVSDFVLIGNPYPSTLNLEAFRNDNPSLGNTFWFWSHQTGGEPDSTADYATYVIGTGGAAANSGGIIPNQYVDKTQGFMTKLDVVGILEFNNSQRSIYESQSFYKSEPLLDRNLIWLGLTHKEALHSNQILVGFVQDATDSYDVDRDGVKIKSSSVLSFYSIVDEKELSIQALSKLDSEESKIIPLGVDAHKSGNYVIGIDSLANISEFYDIYLMDHEEMLNINLKETAYTFFVDSTNVYNSRFALKVVNNEVSDSLSTGKIDQENIQYDFTYFQNNGVLKAMVINASVEIRNAQLVDMKGQQVFIDMSVNNVGLEIPIYGISSGVYLLNAVLSNGDLIRKKVVISSY